MAKTHQIRIRVETVDKTEFEKYCEKHFIDKNKLIRSLIKVIVNSDPKIVVELGGTEKIENKFSVICFQRK